MKSLEESIVTAMDGSDAAILPHLPFILQDLWEIGSDPETIIELVRKHSRDYSRLSVLDLGCGKGAVSVKLARALRCRCRGIDGIPEFISVAIEKARQYDVADLCVFETGDIRERVKTLPHFDIIILGSIGPVFGHVGETLSALDPILGDNGFIILDDGYIQDSSLFSHPQIGKKAEVLRFIAAAGMTLADETIMAPSHIKDADDDIFQKIKRRCFELMERFPAEKAIFADYIRRQEEENDVLETKIVCSTMTIRRI